MHSIVHGILIVIALWLVSGSLLNLSKHPHWYIRGWDFPRVFVAVLAALVAGALGLGFGRGAWDLTLDGALLLVVARNLWLIWPYTRFGRRAVKQATRPPGDDSLRLVISNLLQENDQHKRWSQIIREADPDVIVAVEVSGCWSEHLSKTLGSKYEHRVVHAQDNYYGMAIYSRLAFDAEPELRFLVQNDVPSMHVTLRLRDGQVVRLHAMHPRPPEPLRDQDSAPRDAELVLLAKEIAAHEREVPTIVCGDLNDVAWSFTTQLFLRLSRLLDPRRGRGQYSSFNAKSRIFRFPLDHVFHSNEFELIRLEVLPFVGSDHFPMLIELSCAPQEARSRQGESNPKAGDATAAQEMVERA